MGILSRFRDVMRANIGAMLEGAKEPAAAVDQYMKQIQLDLGQIRAESASLLAAEGRARRALEECDAEIRKLQRYAEKAAESGDDEGALKFLQRKATQAEERKKRQAAYEEAAGQTAKLAQMQEKLTADVNELEARRATLKGKLAEAEAQQRRNAATSERSAFRELEEKADLALNEALALAELRGGSRKDDLDELMAQLERDTQAAKEAQVASEDGNQASGQSESGPVSPEEELAAMKGKLNKES
ncbi:PspA/IM30 family protein [Paenibacillus senegalimassiliensis]|uniref:PspA/IM30 family protein n=1 Tax=Paenibacillus senegalimassiliensis TaxID=1737426 RepID=UPI00073E6391|nr:PspA/IM30 family protein [Paenibacillus senegalimassiliensis]